MAMNAELKQVENPPIIVKYLTDRQVSEMTGIAVQTLRNYRTLHKGPPYIRLYKSIRYRESDIVEFMEKRRVVPTGEKGGANDD